MIEMTTQELRDELALHNLTPEQTAAVMDLAHDFGQVSFTSPSNGTTIDVMADDDNQVWVFGAGRTE